MRRGEVNRVCRSRILGLIALCLGSSQLLGQELKPKFPQEEFVAEVRTGYGGEVKFDPVSGPYGLMGGRNALAFGLGLRYRVRLGENQRTCMGLGLEYLRLPFTFTWDINAKEVYGIDYPSSTNDTYKAERIGLACLWATLEQGFTSGQRPWFFHLAAGAGWSHLDDFFPRFGGFGVRDPDDKDARYTIYTMTAEHRNGWVLMVRAGLGKEWCLPNLNRLGFLFYGQWSGVQDFNSGTYVAYPGTAAESSGKWNQGLNYVGVQLHYAMSFGAPKLPRHLRE